MIMLSPKWGPYDNMDNLPVAVVNNDLGAMSDGEEVNVGNDLIENLEGNRVLGWDFVATEKAEQGMDDMEYYMMIEVPQDFSANVVTVLDPNPVKPELRFTRNEGLHFMAGQVTDNAIETLGNQLSNQVTETYVRNVFSQLGQVTDGFEEAADGLADGAEDSSQLNPSDENMVMFAAPVELAGEVINSFPFYRDSSAPYVLTLALFVGILAMSFIVPFERPAVMPASGTSWFTGKIAKLSVLAVTQAVLISVFSLLFLQLKVESNIMFILFSIGVSLTFLMIVLFLVVLAGNIGRLLALAFVVLQLSTTGSDLPIHMLPEGLRNMSTFLPFTYSIDGFKNIVTLGSFSNVWANIGVLSIYFVIFAVLSLIVFIVKYKGQSVQSEEVEEFAS